MISTLELQQFRGLEHVKFEGLGRANLIVGGNNTGKTSVLEALILLFGGQDQLSKLPTTFRELPGNSEDQGVGFWKLLLKTDNLEDLRLQANALIVKGALKQNTKHLAEAAAGETVVKSLMDFHDAWIPKIYTRRPSAKLAILSTKQKDPSEISELFNQIAPLNPENETRLEDLMQSAIEPRLKRLRYAKPRGAKRHLVYVDLGEGAMLPFTQLGQAFSRTLQIYCEIFANQPDIILIDEIENGLYYEGLGDFWKGLMAVLEDQNVQLFATTHSRECMETAYEAAKGKDSKPLRYVRLDRRVDDPSKIVSTVFGTEEMATAIEFNREMR